MTGRDDLTISYSLRDVLERINDQLTDIRTHLNGKATYEDLVALESRVHQLEKLRYQLMGWAIGVSVGGSTLGTALINAISN